jgi:hypothetical protein
VAPAPRRPGAHQPEEACGALAHLVESDAELL